MLIGLLAGIGGALALGRWLAFVVFEISPWDLRILFASAAVLTMTGFLAAWLPARRATRVAPGMSLRGV